MVNKFFNNSILQSTSDLRASLSKRFEQQDATHDTFPTSNYASSPVLQNAISDILAPSRISALESCDVNTIPYDSYNFFSYIWTYQGRNFGMLIAPLLLLAFWGVAWQVLFLYGFDAKPVYNEQTDSYESFFEHRMSSLGDLIQPLMQPIGFLITFRLGRAAVRFWDARHAIGNVVYLIRSNIAIVCVGLMSPIRLRRIAMLEQLSQKNGDTSNNSVKQNDKDIKTETAALKLLAEYARWSAALPVSVQHFLRPGTRPGWRDEDMYTKKLRELDPLLPASDTRLLLMPYDDKEGKPTFDAANGVRVRDEPLVVLNRMHELAFNVAFFTYTGSRSDLFTPTPEAQAAFYKQLTEHIDAMYGAYGATERIKNTPLPFAYSVHLRTFLLIYLLLWNLTSVATFGWIAIPTNFFVNWLLLGIEAASVDCERPFNWNANHIPLGKISAVVAVNIAEALKELRW
ncbi:hypothetical protein ACHAWX_003664 [Stephanocyclus meneghinianus]